MAPKNRGGEVRWVTKETQGNKVRLVVPEINSDKARVAPQRAGLGGLL